MSRWRGSTSALALTGLGLLALTAAAAEEADPLTKMRDLQYRGKFLEAVAYAKGIAASGQESPGRRAKAFDALAESYLDAGCPRLAMDAYRQAIAAFGRSSEHAAAAWHSLAKLHVVREELGEGATVLEKAIAELDLDKLPVGPRANLFGLLASCRDQMGQDLAALAAYEKLTALPIQGPDATAALAKAARLYAAHHHFEKVEACLSRLDDKLDSGPAVATEAAKAYQELAGKLAAAGRQKEAHALYRHILGLFARRDPPVAQLALQRLLEGTDGDAAAIDFVTSLKGPELRALTAEEALASLVPAALRTGRTGELVRVYTGAALGSPFDEALAVASLRAIMEVRVREGRPGDAVAAAAAAYGVTGFSSSYYVGSYTRAVDLVTQALRARDGHLATANAFRRYQLYGAAGPDAKLGTADDIPNLLAKAAYSPEPELDRLFEDALKAQPPTTAGRRARAWAYLVWCKPKEALSEFRRAFALCSFESTELARAAQDIALGLKALHGTPVGMDAFALFQRYGPAGPDGRTGTADDIRDPLAEIPFPAEGKAKGK